MKVTIYSFTEDTDSGTDSWQFGTEAELHKHMRKLIVDAYGDTVVEKDGQLSWSDPSIERESDDDVLELLNAGDIEGAFADWNENSGFRKHLDTYNWDEKEIEVPMPTEVQALVDAATLARRTFTNDPNDIEWLDARMIQKADILIALTLALSWFNPTEEA